MRNETQNKPVPSALEALQMVADARDLTRDEFLTKYDLSERDGIDGPLWKAIRAAIAKATGGGE